MSEQDKTYFKRLLYSLLRQRFDIREEYDKLFSPQAPVLFGRSPILQALQSSALLCCWESGVGSIRPWRVASAAA